MSRQHDQKTLHRSLPSSPDTPSTPSLLRIYQSLRSCLCSCHFPEDTRDINGKRFAEINIIHRIIFSLRFSMPIFSIIRLWLWHYRPSFLLILNHFLLLLCPRRQIVIIIMICLRVSSRKKYNFSHTYQKKNSQNFNLAIIFCEAPDYIMNDFSCFRGAGQQTSECWDWKYAHTSKIYHYNSVGTTKMCRKGQNL